MPSAPSPACPRCRHKPCTCGYQDAQKASGWHRRVKPKGRGSQYRSGPETRRRRECVEAWTRANCVRTEDGNWYGICPDCGRGATAWVADHVTPIAEGGGESGPLRCHCRRCSNSQGAVIANKRRRG